MHVSGRPVGSFDNEGLIFAAGVDAEVIRLYDLRSFDKVHINLSSFNPHAQLQTKFDIPRSFCLEFLCYFFTITSKAEVISIWPDL